MTCVTPNWQRLFRWSRRGGWYPKFAIMKGNNLFGFKRNSRKFSVVTNAHGYLVYRDFHLSITDYACLERLLIAKYSLNTEEKYRAHIEKHYSQDATYGDKLKKALSLINFETA